MAEGRRTESGQGSGEKRTTGQRKRRAKERGDERAKRRETGVGKRERERERVEVVVGGQRRERGRESTRGESTRSKQELKILSFSADSFRIPYSAAESHT